ncbi:hypothetical protein ABB37_01898 [Leptomonas pyrrhocoris]|uniref:Uncharacterized protein n=1 Tax=Leptomonas pyrrhocoris TaxID=157538 RepID=A0A0M9G705_LEPPY|nr:hypothetical protein ABB37_01898 [Leptomonas pyrrhocoris]XP_015662068.1 hypothetical protein ABB37_01898 [Leptomonas pyrrhocoris]KPA83628.1 hypothetical protein ABB37_01898 [Leptomonas pyrrhocoris]KPA83629.1 hypothetical protein ABB37_01898 [Leptomonas pyrrhocoris]|eukprot:XP_015662067.1 hypothetical protein ABB37_01898 [Leptomonas pyrrhocoris]
MSHSATPKHGRRLCDPAWLQNRFPSISSDVPYELKVSSHQCHSRGQASEEEFTNLISSSFRQTLRDVLPYPESFRTVSSAPGGIWFWEVYRHALFGENVIVHLGGTGLSLTEDFPASQAELRSKACIEYVPASARSRHLLAHGAAKLEVLYALSLTVALHVAKHPVLERAQGPRAVVLCATHSQCIEFTAILNLFCPSLHLVVHNLFEGYPSLPAGKRADVVVGTPPLWESVSQLGGGSSTVNIDAAARLGGLEDLLLDIEGDGQLPPAYNLSRWRPYKLTYVEQLVLFDVELQVSMGFGSILQHVVNAQDAPTSPCKANNEVCPKGGLPISCQQYVVVGEDRFRVDDGAVEILLRAVGERGGVLGNGGTAEIVLASAQALNNDDHLRKRSREGEVDAEEGKTKFRRAEDDERIQERHSAEARSSTQSLPTTVSAPKNFDGLFIRNALSHARLVADFDALTDFTQRLIDVAEEFWLQFEGVAQGEHDVAAVLEGCATDAAGTVSQPSLKPPTAVSRALQVDLALVCVKLDAVDRCKEEVRASSSKVASHRAQELGIWVHPASTAGDAYSSRFVLLFKHLSDHFNGELFDGSIIQCVLAEDTPRLPFNLFPLNSDCAFPVRLLLNDAFVYGENLLRPTLLEMAKKSKSEETEAMAERANERLCVTSARESGDSVQRRGEEGIPFSLFLLPPSRSPSNGALKSSLPVVPVDTGTVMVLRHLLLSQAESCGAKASTGNATTNSAEKPFVLHVIEECCQYGRVLSYHVHEDPLQRPQSSLRSTVGNNEDQPAVTDLATPGAATVTWDTHNTVLSVFVEFASAESAIEAARQFAQRFALQAAETKQPESHNPRVRLFRNSTYYQGVHQDEMRMLRQDSSDTRDVDDNDEFFDELLTESLLAE